MADEAVLEASLMAGAESVMARASETPDLVPPLRRGLSSSMGVEILRRMRSVNGERARTGGKIMLMRDLCLTTGGSEKRLRRC